MLFGSASALGLTELDEENYLTQQAKNIGANTFLDRSILRNLLLTKYTFPSDHRALIWRNVLQLPMNKHQYEVYTSQPMHSSLRTFQRRVPIKQFSVSNRLMRLLSSLLYWHPPLAECDWLAGLVFPFLNVYTRDSLITFEVCCTVISNWCAEWAQFAPNPPITILSRILAISKAHGTPTTIDIAWPALRSFFCEVASTECALMLIDNIISSHPRFLEALVAAFCIQKGKPIINVQNAVSILRKARRIFETMAADDLKEQYSPLPNGHYPVLAISHKSPLWREKELDRIRAESEAAKRAAVLKQEIDVEDARIERFKRVWLEEREILAQIERDQMELFERKEASKVSQTEM